MHQMPFGGRAPPGPAGGAYSAPSYPIAALKLLAPSALDPWRLWRLASRLRWRSETERSGSSFVPIRTLSGGGLMNVKSHAVVIVAVEEEDCSAGPIIVSVFVHLPNREKMRGSQYRIPHSQPNFAPLLLLAWDTVGR